MKRNNLIYTGLVSCLLMATTACSDYLDINQNPEYPTEASSSTLLPSGIAGVASIVGGTYEYMVACGLSNVRRDIHPTSIIHWLTIR